ncbi:MAG: hypothetical protein UX75_C0037G0010 [Candidatus Moranbacteria bacterium GW2011_GWE2_47_10]|nr:MAG: hypothetical protein UX75_C0037G0010 [Candidatus Moranbacteria bacterium GW2011_GWE2_47_10]
MNKISKKTSVLGSLNKNILVVDKAYQRDIVKSRVKNIVAQWAWTAAGVITVNKRDGVYYVVDGQHRVAAAQAIPEITHLDCIINEDMDMKNEAKTFIAINTGHGSVSSVAKFRASIAGGDEIAAYVDKRLESCKFTVAARGIHSAPCPKALCAAAKTNKVAFNLALDIATKLCKHRKLERSIFDAVFYLTNKSLIDDRMRNRIIDVGFDNINFAIKRSMLQHSTRGGVVCARGLIDAINKGLKSKFDVTV